MNSIFDSTNSLWKIGKLNIGDFATLRVKAKINSKGTHKFTSQITNSSNADPNPDNNISNASAGNNIVNLGVKSFVSILPNGQMNNNLNQLQSDPLINTSDLVGTSSNNSIGFGLYSYSIDYSTNISDTNLPPIPGDTIEFTSIVENESDVDIKNLTLLDLLPTGYNYESVNTNDIYDSSSGIWQIKSLAAHSKSELKISAVMRSSGQYINVVKILEGSYSDITSYDNTAYSTPFLSSDSLKITQSIDDEFKQVNDSITYHIKLTNNTASVVHHASLFSLLPSGIEYISSSLNYNSTYDYNSGQWFVRSLMPGESSFLNLTGRILDNGSYKNRVWVKYND